MKHLHREVEEVFEEAQDLRVHEKRPIAVTDYMPEAKAILFLRQHP